ncbi:MAG: hypothetical protein IPL83_07575 [Bdellovibrionales bacterium]|nr:hypothetical protein [Bdellovibrionales bacterium]
MDSSLKEEAIITFVFVTDCEFSHGLISLADWTERDEVLEWLVDEKNTIQDPRSNPSENQTSFEVRSVPSDDENQQMITLAKTEDEPQFLEFLPRGLKSPWLFTIGDADNYPSVPHGHLEHKCNPWPKLNPYTGRAFKSKDIEEPKLRLVRKEMVHLWNDKNFCEHAHKQIAYYSAKFPHHNFPVRVNRIFRLPRWKF